MSRTLQALRPSITVRAFLMSGASAQAADVAVQRLAMACPHGSDAAGCKAAPMHSARHLAAARTVAAVAKAPARRTQDARVASHDSDGSRFTYDSCGCSN